MRSSPRGSPSRTTRLSWRWRRLNAESSTKPTQHHFEANALARLPRRASEGRFWPELACFEHGCGCEPDQGYSQRFLCFLSAFPDVFGRFRAVFRQFSLKKAEIRLYGTYFPGARATSILVWNMGLMPCFDPEKIGFIGFISSPRHPRHAIVACVNYGNFVDAYFP